MSRRFSACQSCLTGGSSRRLCLTAWVIVALAVALAGCAQVVAHTASKASDRDRAIGRVTAPCRAPRRLPAALFACRNWISFAPPAPFDPTRGVDSSVAQLRRALRQLAREGWRGLVTYSLDGALAEVPRLAREAGFDAVIAGLFWFDKAQLAREQRAALAQRRWIDAYIVGSEGLTNGRYTLASLRREIARLHAITGRPVATTEPVIAYQRIPALASVGDWAFPNIHPWFANHHTPEGAARWVRREYCSLRAHAPGRVWVIHESWWPTRGADPAANPVNQVRFFRALLRTPLPMVLGEAYDQPWKQEGDVGPSWGWHYADMTPKPVISALRSMYAPAPRVDFRRACPATP